jgi:ubiquinone/menaquinone biosynthesis C-methylase UbiE
LRYQFGMGSGRRHIDVHDHSAWVFNRMVEAYGVRPRYPIELLDALQVGLPASPRILDLGAGLGHVALPLAERGLSVTAVEPAALMVAELSRLAAERGAALTTVHAKAEALPLPNASFDLVVIADALHFFNVELAAAELDRVLAPGGAVAVVSSSHDDTPFMRELDALIAATSDRRTRAVAAPVQQLFRLVRAKPQTERVFCDQTSVSRIELENILGSISFVRPALTGPLAQAFRAGLSALPAPAVWARRLELRVARASRRRRPRVAKLAGEPRTSEDTTAPVPA